MLIVRQDTRVAQGGEKHILIENFDTLPIF